MLRGLINRYKRLNAPWKSRTFVGSDLNGNMYFEIPGTSRRMVDYVHGEIHVSQYHPDSIPVAWLAWLRHTRPHAPTIQELEADVDRLVQLQQKVAQIALADGQPITIAPPLQSNPSDTFKPDVWAPQTRR